MAVTTHIVDKDGNRIDASTATVPSDRHFRGAWSLDGTVISEDMTAAKVIFKDKIREVRAPLLAAEDVVYMKALEADDASATSVQAQIDTHEAVCAERWRESLVRFKRLEMILIGQAATLIVLLVAERI